MTQPPISDIRSTLREHLDWWGLRRCVDEATYYEWQRRTLSQEELVALTRLAQQRHASGDARDDMAFYDLSAHPNILPILYSQRYDYYMTVGPEVTMRLTGGRRILDFGCGVGILTTFYACCFPDREFVGIDRSSESIAVARKCAELLGLRNVQFECSDAPKVTRNRKYDLVVSTHALFQSEQEAGLPSRDWQTFERIVDPCVQAALEDRTGLKDRLERLCQVLLSKGKLIVFEKARHLGRRVLLQRALIARGLQLIEEPMKLCYRSIDEVTDDGPLYILTRNPVPVHIAWSEDHEISDDHGLYRCRGEVAKKLHSLLPRRLVVYTEQWVIPNIGKAYAEWGTSNGVLTYGYVMTNSDFSGLIVGSVQDERVIQREIENIHYQVDDAEQWEARLDTLWPSTAGYDDPASAPLYENHSPAAQDVWASLSDRQIQQSATLEEVEGRQMHIELGTCFDLVYLYWANTFDQRQLVIVEKQRAHLLEEYYRESLEGVKFSAQSEFVSRPLT